MGRATLALILLAGSLAACGQSLALGTPDEPGAPRVRQATPMEDNEPPKATIDPPVRVASCGEAPSPAVDTSDLDPFFTTKMRAAKVPGLSVAVIGDGRIKWAKGYGLANIAAQKPVKTDTLFMLASVSKAVTAVALMQLIEDPARGLMLDHDVNEKLPFKVRNPNFKSTPITYRMLLTHTSGLIDSDEYWAIAEPDVLPKGDSPITLLDFATRYVARDDSWADSAPGKRYAYSNTGAALLGLLVERISRKNLDEFSKERIFERLGMNESSWFFRNLDPSHIATPYEPDLTPIQHYGYPDYPAGQLRTSAPQLARFLLMFAQEGECGQRVLAPETVAMMRKLQLPGVATNQGLIWYYENKGGTKAFGHNGSDRGVSTDMFFDPASGNGYVLLTNGSTNISGVGSRERAMTEMNDKLMDLAKTLP